jgi:hypothetical protein
MLLEVHLDRLFPVQIHASVSVDSGRSKMMLCAQWDDIPEAVRYLPIGCTEQYVV